MLLADLVRFADRTRFRHSVCCLGQDGPQRGPLEASGCSVHVMNRRGRVDLLRVVAAAMRLLRQVRPHVIHVHRAAGDFWGQVLALGYPAARVVVTEHSLYANDAGDPRIRWPNTFARRLLRGRITQTITISRAVADDLLAWRLTNTDRVTVIHNGVDTDSFVPAATPRGEIRRIGAAGRIISPKGYEFLLEAISRISKRHPSVRLVIAGEGPDRRRLEALAGELDVVENVDFLGAVADMAGFYQGIDLFVLPSLREGFGIALVEAMSCGLPVIASRVGGITEIVEDGVNGLLVPAADAAVLAEAISRCLDAPEYVRRLGMAARNTAQDRFSIRGMVRRYELVYAAALAETARSA